MGRLFLYSLTELDTNSLGVISRWKVSQESKDTEIGHHPFRDVLLIYIIIINKDKKGVDYICRRFLAFPTT